MIKKRKLLVWFSLLFIIVILVFLFIQFGYAIDNENGKIVDAVYLKSLRSEVNVECLQNSQCSDDYECIKSQCLSKNSKDLCKTISLSTSSNKLIVGDRINLNKKVIIDAQLPGLFGKGELVKIVDNKPQEYFYKQYILIGDEKIVNDGMGNVIKIENSSEPIYTLRILFSNGIDFSDREIHGQALRVFNKEYLIGGDSTNSIISLASSEDNIKLEDGQKVNLNVAGNSNFVENSNVKIIKDSENKVVALELAFNMQGLNKDKISVGDKYTNPLFNSVYLSFNSVDAEGYADLSIGGKC